MLFNPQPKEKRWISPSYRNFIRTHPCCVCGNHFTVAHHVQVKGNGKMGGKESDCWCVPLCHNHHVGDEGIHVLGRAEFNKRFEVNFYKVVATLLMEWVSK